MFYASGEQSQLYSGLIRMQNGIYFLDILDKYNWNEVYSFASEHYRNEEKMLLRKEQEFLKHVWFENYIFSSPFVNKESSRYIPLMQQLTKE